MEVALASRAFQARAVGYLADEAGIRQFLDVGAGLPAGGNTHEVAQGIAPRARVLYVDHDPFVVSHGRSQLAGMLEGFADYIEADLHQPAEILRSAARVLDFSQPIGLVLMGVMGHLDEDDAYPIVRQLLGGLAAGSFLALQDGAEMSDAFTEAQEDYDDTAPFPITCAGRSRSPRSSRAWTSWTLEWSRPRSGARNRARPARWRWTRSAASA